MHINRGTDRIDDRQAQQFADHPGSNVSRDNLLADAFTLEKSHEAFTDSNNCGPAITPFNFPKFESFPTFKSLDSDGICLKFTSLDLALSSTGAAIGSATMLAGLVLAPELFVPVAGAAVALDLATITAPAAIGCAIGKYFDGRL